MYATVVDVDGDDVILEVAPGVEVRYMRRAVMDVVSPGRRDAGRGSVLGTAEDEADADDDGEPDTARVARTEDRAYRQHQERLTGALRSAQTHD